MIPRSMIPLVASLALFAAPAFARPQADDAGATLVDAAAALPPNRFLWRDVAVAGPVSVIVSIADQRAYVYRGYDLVAVSAVSTGRPGNDTPVGTFTILQKAAVHRSTIYDSAPMPYMQRLTWDGVALHAGRNPGYAASHGCVRLPTAFARKLFEATKLGAQVTVTDLSVTSDDGPQPRIADPVLATSTNYEAMLAGR